MKTLSKERLDHWVQELRPPLIDRARAGKTIPYGELWNARGWIGQVIGEISHREHQADRPLLSALVVHKTTGMPGHGFWGFDVMPAHLWAQPWEDQGKVPPDDVKELRRKWWEEETARVYDYWRSKDPQLAHRKYGSGGEGQKHKALKEWCAKHPHELGLHDVVQVPGITEFDFVSGDRADIVFGMSGNRYAVVEVEAKTEDTLQGAHQALKYRVLMCAKKGLPIMSDKVEGLLAAFQVPGPVRKFCDTYNLRYVEIPPEVAGLSP